MTLEEALQKCAEVLRLAGYPVMFMEVSSAKPTGEGGWQIIYRHALAEKELELIVDGRGEVRQLERR